MAVCYGPAPLRREIGDSNLEVVSVLPGRARRPALRRLCPPSHRLWKWRIPEIPHVATATTGRGASSAVDVDSCPAKHTTTFVEGRNTNPGGCASDVV